MEPITLILTALAAGAAIGAPTVGKEMIQDGYQGLKTIIKRKFGDNQAAVTALEQYEAKPEVWEAPLKDALQESGAGEDKEIIQAAQQVMAVANPEQAAQGTYNVQIKGDVYGLVQDNKGEITQTFNFDKKSE